jgi:hypothetical protein
LSVVDPGVTENAVQLYAIIRRGGWANAQELDVAAARSREVGDQQMAEQVRWIRSYVTAEPDGRVGTICIYQAVSPEAIHEHARQARLPVDEVVPISATVLVRPDPA